MICLKDDQEKDDHPGGRAVGLLSMALWRAPEHLVWVEDWKSSNTPPLLMDQIIESVLMFRQVFI